MEAAFQNIFLGLSKFYSPGEGKVFKMIFACEINACVQDPGKLCLEEQPCCEEFICTKSKIQ